MSHSHSDLINNESRETFKTRFGFIWSCVGSAVGIGTIWMFPYRLGQYGGSAFLIEYIIFTLLLGFSGVIGEMAFGRAMRTGPIGAFIKATKMRFNKNFGGFLGIIPVLGSLCIAIGYSVVVGWIIRFLIESISGKLMYNNVSTFFSSISGDFGNIVCHLIGLIIIFLIMIFGISNGIEKLNKFMMPIFFALFLILAFRVLFLPKAFEGYTYLFRLDFKQLLVPRTWIYALGQSFFSLSLAGSGTLIYGSYLKENEDIVYCAKNIVFFDTLAGIIAALAIIPAMFSFGLESQAGPALMFITMPQIFAQMPFGIFFEIIFFIAILFAALTSLVNLFETPIEVLQSKFKLSRKLSTLLIITFSAIIGLFIENGETVGKWMDVVSIYVIPLGALLAGIMFFWICGSKFSIQQVNKGRGKKIGKWFIPMSKYIFIIITFLVFVSGIFFGGI